jgi:hypothetical protein
MSKPYTKNFVRVVYTATRTTWVGQITQRHTARIEELRMMDCLHPLAPNDEELLRLALDDEALSAEASGHLEQCPTCQQRLASYKRNHTILVSRLYRSQCPDSTTLSLYCADLLPPGEQLSIANHLLDCPLCAAEAADTRQFLAQPYDDLLPSSPSPKGLHATVSRIFATLIKQQAQLVLRAGPSEAAWPRQYRADSINLSLHLSRASSGEYILLGIISSPTEPIENFAGLTAELYPAADGKDTDRAEKALLSEQVDDLGNIVFRHVPVGDYVMIVYLPERELVIEGVNIQPG